MRGVWRNLGSKISKQYFAPVSDLLLQEVISILYKNILLNIYEHVY